MKKYFWLLVAGGVAVATSIGLPACKKNNTNTVVTNPDGTAMANFLQANAPKPQSFTVDATAGGSFTSAKGFVYTIPPQVFATTDGKTVTGTVDISVREITTPSEMLFSNRPTMTSNGQMLLSYGEINIAVKQNNHPVVLRMPQDSMGIDVAVLANANAQAGANLWSGDTTIISVNNGYDYQNRPVSDATTITLDKGILWSIYGIGYAFFNPSNGTLDFQIDSLAKWVNCDAVYTNPNNNTTLLCYFNSYYNYVTTTDYTGDQPTMIFFKPKGQNTLIKLYDVIMNAPAGYQGFLSYEKGMQIGATGTFLAMSTIGGKFYADMKDTVVPAPSGSNNYSTLTFNPQEVSESDMINLIQSLNSK
jgi:hypothetical protein